MTLSPFKPLGDTARWRVIYALLTKRNIDDVLTYDEMGLALDLDPVEDKHTLQVTMRRAAKELEQVDKRATEAVPNIGYRIVEPVEHLRLAKGHEKRATRQLVRGRSKVVNVDLSNVDPEIRKAFQIMALRADQTLAVVRQHDVTIRRQQEALNAVAAKSTKTEEEVAEILDRLKRLEDKGKAQ